MFWKINNFNCSQSYYKIPSKFDNNFMSKLFVIGKIVKLFVICTQISYELEYYTHSTKITKQYTNAGN